MTSRLDYSDPDSTTERIVGVFDVLGFRNALKTIGTNKLVRSYAAAIGKAQAILRQTVEAVYMHVPAEYVEDEGFPGSANTFAEPRFVQASVFPGVEEITIFSDSIFVFGANDSSEVLRHVLRSSVVLFRVFLESGLPLAGAIAKGDAVVDTRLDVYAGAGIVAAYELANAIDIVGIVVHPDIQKLDEGMSEAVKIPRKRDKNCQKQEPLNLMVPIAPTNDLQLTQIRAPWKKIVKQQVEKVASDRKVFAKWKHSSKILSAMLNTKIEIE